MGVVSHGDPAVVTIAVVAYGLTERLADCVRSVVTHESSADFNVVVVINPDSREGHARADFPDHVMVLNPDANLGWAGGLQLARHSTDAEWIAWIQDDSQVLPGWLDHLLEAAATRPGVGAFGSVAVGAEGEPVGFSGGVAQPADSVALWNSTDPTPHGVARPSVTDVEWVTSKGMLVRTSAWDDVGGPCARQYPLGHVDKEFSTHLRSHGWGLAVVPGANVSHLQSQSAPMLFRRFLNTWHEDAFDRRWSETVRQLETSNGAAVAHDCHDHPSMDAVERECLIEATRMVVPCGIYANEEVMAVHEQARLAGANPDTLIAEYRREAEAARESLAAAEARVDALLTSTSWRVTAPWRWASGLLRAAVRRR